VVDCHGLDFGEKVLSAGVYFIQLGTDLGRTQKKLVGME